MSSSKVKLKQLRQSKTIDIDEPTDFTLSLADYRSTQSLDHSPSKHWSNSMNHCSQNMDEASHTHEKDYIENLDYECSSLETCQCKLSGTKSKKISNDKINTNLVTNNRWNQFRSRFLQLGTHSSGSKIASMTDVGYYCSSEKLTQKRLSDTTGANNLDINADEKDSQQKQSTSSYLKEQFLSFFQPSDNKLALKLFGSKSAVIQEKRRQQKEGKWIIHPCSSFRFYWDLFMLVLLIANLIILPVIVSFFSDDTRIQWVVFNCFSDTVFLADIAVNFRTGLLLTDKSDEIILNPKIIARNYLRSWFFLDLISSIPLDYIFLAVNRDGNYHQIAYAGRTLRILRLAKLLSMLRLLRLSRLVRYVSQWEEFLNIASKFIGICKLVLLMLLLGHWNACIQFLIPLLMEFPTESWVVKCKLQHSDWFEQYTWSLFKAMSHMLSIGYGRFPPTSISEAWITIISMMTGATCYALFVGHAAALIQSFDTSKRLYREKFKQVEEYMTYRKLPRALRQRIANYYEHRYQGKMFNEDQILTELNECLREQVINYNCRALVAAVPFFTYADQSFVSEVVSKLMYEVFQPGDLIIKEGTIGTKMYFIQEGIVDIITKDGEVVTSLSDGSYFGEICLLTNAKRCATVRAEVYCSLYSLDSEQFKAVLENYPLMRRTMESVAAERLTKIGYNPDIITNREDFKDDLDMVKEIVSSVSPMVSDDENDPAEDNNNNTEKGFNGSLKKAKETRRKSVVKLGLHKLGLIKSKSNTSLVEKKDNQISDVISPKKEKRINIEKEKQLSKESLNLLVRSPDGLKNTHFKISFDMA